MTADGPVTFELDGPDAVERRLAVVAGARREANRVRARIAEVEQELETLDAEVTAATARIGSEAADVRRLQSFTLTGILSDLRGQRESDLEREIAELADAQYLVATLRERQDAVVGELVSLQDRLVALGDPDAEWDDALAGRERWVELTGPVSDRLSVIAGELGDLDDERVECDEAREVAGEALIRLDRVAESLGSAEDWTGYDTWFGGGVLTSSERHDQLDDATKRMHEAEDSLRRLGKELAGLGDAVETTIRVHRWDRVFDVCFEDVFADASMRRRIADAIALVDLAQERVGRIAGVVEERSRGLTARIEELQQERATLLLGPNAEM